MALLLTVVFDCDLLGAKSVTSFDLSLLEGPFETVVYSVILICLELRVVILIVLDPRLTDSVNLDRRYNPGTDHVAVVARSPRFPRHIFLHLIHELVLRSFRHGAAHC